MLVHRRQRGLTAANLIQMQFHRPRWYEPLVDEHVDRIRMIDGDELDLVRVRRLPELLGELEQIVSITRRQRIAGDAHVLL